MQGHVRRRSLATTASGPGPETGRDTTDSGRASAASFYYVVLLIVGVTGVSFTSSVFIYALIRLRVINADFSRNLVIFFLIATMVEIAVFLGMRSVHQGAPSVKPEEWRCPSCGFVQEKSSLFSESCGKSMA